MESTNEKTDFTSYGMSTRTTLPGSYSYYTRRWIKNSTEILDMLAPSLRRSGYWQWDGAIDPFKNRPSNEGEPVLIKRFRGNPNDPDDWHEVY